MAGSARDLRSALRVLHLIIGTLLATYVYLRPGTASWLRWPLMVVAVPAITISGVWMWKQAAIRRLVNRRRPVDNRATQRGSRRPLPTRTLTAEKAAIDTPRQLIDD